MGFVSNIILDSDVFLRNITKEFKSDHIKTYHETDGFEVINPTLDIVKYFGDSIKYSTAATLASVIRNNRLEVFNALPNKYTFVSREDLVRHLEDDSKLYYLSKVTTQFGNWNLFVYEQSNISNIRDTKIDKILGCK